ncbi:hypothetical protein E2C01_012102 [Portunus trituberculatus]|uniref:Uncharacterized protein n=1 Tax=Portunus trituberculatus TaxID=210409 RepID=A0A5B7DD23_PORTR|nr:hypothetical protein [Portunus trituberculatus]
MALWQEPENLMVLEGARCNTPEDILKDNYSIVSNSKKRWTHFKVVMEEQQVKLYLLENQDKLFTLNCQGYSASLVTVVPYRSRYGYSSFSDINHPLLLASTLPAMMVVMVTMVIVIVVWFYIKFYCTQDVATEAISCNTQNIPHSPGDMGCPINQTPIGFIHYGSDNGTMVSDSLIRHASKSSLCWPPDLLTQYKDDMRLSDCPTHDESDIDILQLPSFLNNHNNDSNLHWPPDLFTNYDCYNTL